MATLTIELSPEEQRRLEEEAARRQLPAPELARLLLHTILIHELLLLDLPPPSPGDATAAAAWEDARQRLQEALARNPALSARFNRPLIQDDPEHDILDRLRAGEFRR